MRPGGDFEMRMRRGARNSFGVGSASNIVAADITGSENHHCRLVVEDT